MERSYKSAFEWYSQAAAGEDMKGQYHLSTMYFEGNYVQVNTDKAYQLFAVSLEYGYRESEKYIRAITMLRHLQIYMATFPLADYEKLRRAVVRS
jgi:TPR repeat protein